jgi:16S rRNA G966 N2-methylase RsmD
MMLNTATQQFIREHLRDDVRQLALQSHRYPSLDIDFLLALTQISGRQQIEHKIPSWYSNDNLLYPKRLSLEQSSSETMAKYKSTLLSGNTLADLTGGLGVDTAFLAPNFSTVYYVEQQTALAAIAQSNFKSLNLNQIQVFGTDNKIFLETMPAVDCIFIDPARRSDTGKKVCLIEDCEPDLLEIQDLLLQKAQRILVKLSPMLDIQAACKVLKNISEIHVVGVENECKELLFLIEKEIITNPKIVCVNLRKKGNQTDIFDFPEEKQAQIPFVSELKNYLYEPNVAILKAGMYKLLGLRYGLEKLHPDSHLYTSESLVSGFPGRAFQIENVFSFQKQELKTHLQSIRQANVVVRNFPLSVAGLRKKLNLKEGGDIYLFATTLTNERRVLVLGRKLF